METEAYLGSMDGAAHTWRGRRTPRVEPMYMDGGHLYVFLVYGMHHCANVVTGPEGIGEAVLLRAAEAPGRQAPRLMSGPGKLCAALEITRKYSGLDLLSGGDLRLFRFSEETPDIGVSRRIGVDYAGEAADWPLRFFDRNSPASLRTAQSQKPDQPLISTDLRGSGIREGSGFRCFLNIIPVLILHSG